MATLLVIPARAGSQRFFRKPLAQVCGITLIERTHRIAQAVPHVDEIVVATDDDAIAQHVRSFGGKAMFTPEARNGSERAAWVLDACGQSFERVVNLQGDAILTPPGAVTAALSGLEQAQASTVAVPLTGAHLVDYEQHKRSGRASGTTVVCNLAGDALYFSKATLPLRRHAPPAGSVPAWRHLGLYAYRAEALRLYAQLAPTPLELTEGLEQLRWLEHGHAMRVVPYDLGPRAVWSIDYPEDIAVAEALLNKQGEAP